MSDDKAYNVSGNLEVLVEAFGPPGAWKVFDCKAPQKGCVLAGVDGEGTKHILIQGMKPMVIMAWLALVSLHQELADIEREMDEPPEEPPTLH